MKIINVDFRSLERNITLTVLIGEVSFRDDQDSRNMLHCVAVVVC